VHTAAIGEGARTGLVGQQDADGVGWSAGDGGQRVAAMPWNWINGKPTCSTGARLRCGMCV